MMAAMGLKWGTQMKATLAATASAHMTAIVTSSLAWGRLLSNCTKNGTMAQITTTMLATT